MRCKNTGWSDTLEGGWEREHEAIELIRIVQALRSIDGVHLRRSHPIYLEVSKVHTCTRLPITLLNRWSIRCKFEMRNNVRPDCFESLMFAEPYVVPDVSHGRGAFDFGPVFQEEIHLNLKVIKSTLWMRGNEDSTRC
jgi:hypothetical protein